MAKRHQKGTKIRTQTIKDDEEEQITIITIPVTEEGQEETEDVYNSVMNIEEFLAEHNVRMEESDNSDESQHSVDIKPVLRPSIIVKPTRVSQNNSSSSHLYKESKRELAEREREAKRKKLEEEVEFSAEDLSLATIPGLEFDPKERSFEMEELRPQPIIKKRSKLFVDDQEKDAKYWEKREKNNNAARRSREARRLKENQIALRVAHLERENSNLKQVLTSSQFDVTKLTNQRDFLKRKLSGLEAT